MHWGAPNNPHHCGEFKPRVSQPRAAIRGTNKRESHSQRWELAPRAERQVWRAKNDSPGHGDCCCCCPWVCWGTATSGPWDSQSSYSTGTGVTATRMGSLHAPEHRCPMPGAVQERTGGGTRCPPWPSSPSCAQCPRCPQPREQHCQAWSCWHTPF